VSSYKNIIFILLLPLLFIGCINKQNPSQNNTALDTLETKIFEQEDLFILFALEAINQKDYKSAFELFLSLYNATKKFEYLQKALDIALLNQEYLAIVNLLEANIATHPQKQDSLNFIYALALMNTNQVDKSLEIVQNLLRKNKTSQNYILLGNIYLIKQEYQNSFDAFIVAYEEQPKNIGLLMVVSEILYKNLNQSKKAIELLDNYIAINGCNVEICERIYTYYMEQNDIDGMISTLQKNYQLMLSLDKQEEALKTLNVIVEMFKLKDINLAIEFVEGLDENEFKILKLVELYSLSKNLDKLLFNLDKLYQITKHEDILAKMAISIFELSVDKEKILNQVIEKFDIVLQTSTNHVYQNYLGYLLIDYDIDYNRGIALVKLALEQEPENIAYLDSLAWGYYKLQDCKRAYEYMFDIVNKIGQDEPEIKLHWEAIKNCKE
jgi:tetratricopeptide (TPR) repeat protein